MDVCLLWVLCVVIFVYAVGLYIWQLHCQKLTHKPRNGMEILVFGFFFSVVHSAHAAFFTLLHGRFRHLSYQFYIVNALAWEFAICPTVCALFTHYLHLIKNCTKEFLGLCVL
jgi:hypothetical protein